MTGMMLLNFFIKSELIYSTLKISDFRKIPENGIYFIPADGETVPRNTHTIKG